MTRIFRPVVVDGFEWVQPVEESDQDAVYQLDGTPRSSGWRPIRVRQLLADEQGRPWESVDLPWLGGHALVFRDSAYRAVSSTLREAGEFLALDLVDGTDQLWLFNVCRVVDALDEEASGVVRFPSTGRVMKLKQHVFRPELLSGAVAFRVPQSRSLFLTGDAVDAINSANLTGAAFELVWPS